MATPEKLQAMTFKLPIPLMKRFDFYWREKQHRNRTAALIKAIEAALKQAAR